MTCEQALPLVRQMVSALAAAHQLGIVHRDFKPGNVMLLQTARGPLAKVTDFGLATNPACDETVAESVVDVVGTPEFMAPEQLRGQCSNRTDIYALGLTVFQMLTAKLPGSHDAPFKGLDADLRQAHRATLAGSDHEISGHRPCRQVRYRGRVLVRAVGRRPPRAIGMESYRRWT